MSGLGTADGWIGWVNNINNVRGYSTRVFTNIDNYNAVRIYYYERGGSSVVIGSSVDATTHSAEVATSSIIVGPGDNNGNYLSFWHPNNRSDDRAGIYRTAATNTTVVIGVGDDDQFGITRSGAGAIIIYRVIGINY